MVFVGETAVAGLAPGTELAVRCDGCPDGLTATVSYVSDEPEFTPPVIYSVENRQKLVYRVEARPGPDARALRPGQIVDVGPRGVTAMPDTVIDVRHLTKRFGGRAVVDDVSMTVNRGEIVGFLGPNGSGKTTTIRMMCGLLTLDEGEGEVLGHDLRTESRAIKDQVGYMTQKFSLYEDLTIEENLDLVAGLYRLPDPRAAVARHPRHPRPDLAPPAVRRQALRRLEAAPRARRLHHARSRSSSSSTSRPPASTPRPAASSGTRSTSSPPAASPCSSPPTTWTRPSAATASATSPTAA